MRELILPTVLLRDSWLNARDEWGREVHQPGSGLRQDDEVETETGFSAWIGRFAAEANTAVPPAEGRVHADYWWISEEQRYLGASRSAMVSTTSFCALEATSGTDFARQRVDADLPLGPCA